jgi:hypothetical protein
VVPDAADPAVDADESLGRLHEAGAGVVATVAAVGSVLSACQNGRVYEAGAATVCSSNASDSASARS